MKVVLVFVFALLGSVARAADPVLTVFNSKEGADISYIFNAFQQKTGVQVRLVSESQDKLLARIKAGESADLIIVNDVVNLSALTKDGLFQPITSPVLEASIPAQFRDPSNRWFGLSYKVRTIMYNSIAVDPSELDSYEDLADPKWKGQLCLRNSQKTYNRALVASLIFHHGVEGAKRIVRGWVANLAVPPIDGDAKVLEAMTIGTCQVAILNTYYLGRAVTGNPSFPVKAFWANQKDRGAHANIAGMGLLKISKQRDLTLRLMEYLSSAEAQQLFADSNFEYPVNSNVRAGTVVGQWDDFRLDETPISVFGDLSDLAAQLSKTAGY